MKINYNENSEFKEEKNNNLENIEISNFNKIKIQKEDNNIIPSIQRLNTNDNNDSERIKDNYNDTKLNNSNIPKSKKQLNDKMKKDIFK